MENYVTLFGRNDGQIAWTMSDIVKYRAAVWSFLKLTALVFYHV